MRLSEKGKKVTTITQHIVHDLVPEVFFGDETAPLTCVIESLVNRVVVRSGPIDIQGRGPTRH
jgi:5-methylthioribose kinase